MGDGGECACKIRGGYHYREALFPLAPTRDFLGLTFFWKDIHIARITRIIHIRIICIICTIYIRIRIISRIWIQIIRRSRGTRRVRTCGMRVRGIGVGGMGGVRGVHCVWGGCGLRGVRRMVRECGCVGVAGGRVVHGSGWDGGNRAIGICCRQDGRLAGHNGSGHGRGLARDCSR